MPAGGAKTYCWERATQRAVVNEAGDFVFQNYFIPTSVKSTGSLVYSEFEGSTCYQVSTTYRGRVYTYWTPSGCP